MSANFQRAVLPSRSFIAARPTSKQLVGRQLTEFSLSATFDSDGTIGNHSLQLQWSNDVPVSSDSGSFAGCAITDKTNTPSTAASKWANSGSKSTPSTDAFASVSATKSASGSPSRSSSKVCSCATTSPIKINQMVRMVSVELKIVFFDYPGLLVRKSIVRELKNDMTILQILQQMIRQSGIKLDPRRNSETARLFSVRKNNRGKAVYDEVDYLQWRCSLLAEMSHSDSIEFFLDCTDADDQVQATKSSKSSSRNKQYTAANSSNSSVSSTGIP